MSRSRRAPVFTEGYKSKDKKLRKRRAARRVRTNQEVGSGSAYKKESNPWDICDFKFHCPENPKARRK